MTDRTNQDVAHPAVLSRDVREYIAGLESTVRRAEAVLREVACGEGDVGKVKRRAVAFLNRSKTG